MTERSSVRLFHPLGWAPYVVAGIAVTLTVLVGNSGMYSWPYQLWSETSAAFHQRLDLAGPVAAFFGAYVSGRLTPPTRMFALPGMARDRLTYSVVQLAPVWVALGVGYLAGLAPLVFLTIRSATYGRLDGFVALGGLVALIATATAGWLVGLLARSAFIAPVAFAAAFATTLLGYSGDDFAAIFPVTSAVPQLGFHESEPLVLYRIAFFVVVLAVAILAGGAILANRGFSRRPPRVMSAVLWVPVLGLAIAGVSTSPALFQGDSILPADCRDQDGISYCVHIGNEHRLDEMFSVAAPIVTRFGTSSSPFSRIYDRALAGPFTQPSDAYTFYYDLRPSLDTATVLPNLVLALAGLDICSRQLGINTNAPVVTNANALANRLRDAPSDTATGTSFQALSDDELRQWVAHHRDEIAGCAIENEDLPS